MDWLDALPLAVQCLLVAVGYGAVVLVWWLLFKDVDKDIRV